LFQTLEADRLSLSRHWALGIGYWVIGPAGSGGQGLGNNNRGIGNAGLGGQSFGPLVWTNGRYGVRSSRLELAAFLAESVGVADQFFVAADKLVGEKVADYGYAGNPEAEAIGTSPVGFDHVVGEEDGGGYGAGHKE